MFDPCPWCLPKEEGEGDNSGPLFVTAGGDSQVHVSLKVRGIVVVCKTCTNVHGYIPLAPKNVFCIVSCHSFMLASKGLHRLGHYRVLFEGGGMHGPLVYIIAVDSSHITETRIF